MQIMKIQMALAWTSSERTISYHFGRLATNCLQPHYIRHSIPLPDFDSLKLLIIKLTNPSPLIFATFVAHRCVAQKAWVDQHQKDHHPTPRIWSQT